MEFVSDCNGPPGKNLCLALDSPLIEAQVYRDRRGSSHLHKGTSVTQRMPFDHKRACKGGSVDGSAAGAVSALYISTLDHELQKRWQQ